MFAVETNEEIAYEGYLAGVKTALTGERVRNPFDPEDNSYSVWKSNFEKGYDQMSSHIN